MVGGVIEHQHHAFQCRHFSVARIHCVLQLRVRERAERFIGEVVSRG